MNNGAMLAAADYRPRRGSLKSDQVAARSGAAASASTLVSASDFHALLNLTSILEMAAPADAKPGSHLTSPLMALALRTDQVTPGGSAQGVLYAPDQATVTNRTPEALAEQIITKLGFDGALSLEDAKDALIVDNPGRRVNSAATLERLFDRCDPNHDGRLSQTELTKLLRFYHDHSSPFGPAPKLPDSWA